ncbi:MAG: hypothetical protein ACXWM7_03240 [Parachlamydiaceae bacterium]
MDPVRAGCSANTWSPEEKMAVKAAILGVVEVVAGAIFLAMKTAAIMSLSLVVPVTFCVIGSLTTLVAAAYLFNRMSLEDKGAGARYAENLVVLYPDIPKGSDLDLMLGDPNKSVRESIRQKNNDNVLSTSINSASVTGSDKKTISAPTAFLKDLERAPSFTLQGEVLYSNAWNVDERGTNIGKAIEKLQETFSKGRTPEEGKRIAERVMRCLVQTNRNDLAGKAGVLYVSRNKDEAFELVVNAHRGDQPTNVSSFLNGNGGWSVVIQPDAVRMTIMECLKVRHVNDPERLLGVVGVKREIQIPLAELADSRDEEAIDPEQFLPNLVVRDKWSKFFSVPSRVKTEENLKSWVETVRKRLANFK